MSEAALCQLASVPKRFSYIDDENNKYIEKIIILKDDINETNLKLFFSTIYRMKLDNGYGDSFAEGKNSGCLIDCFKKIMMSRIINLEPLYLMINKNCQNGWMPVDYAIEAFFNMFETLEERSYSLREYNALLRANGTNPLFTNTESDFDKENKFIEYNTKMIETMEKKQTRKSYVKKLAQ